MPSVVGIQKFEVICDVVFDLLLKVMCNFCYFEIYKYIAVRRHAAESNSTQPHLLQLLAVAPLEYTETLCFELLHVRVGKGC